MKKIIFLITLLVLFSCKKESQESTTEEAVSEESAVNIAKTPETLGKEIFESHVVQGCSAECADYVWVSHTPSRTLSHTLSHTPSHRVE